jgi:CheY-like chemotaxis protein
LLHSSSDDSTIHEAAKRLDIRFSLTKPIKAKELLFYIQNLSKNSMDDIHSKPTFDATPATTPTTIDGAYTILVAEDIKMNMLVIGNMLQNVLPQLNMHEAVNGVAVLEKLETLVPDLILMDVQMPVMDGIEATRKIRKMHNDALKNIPIVALTAGVSKEEREKCQKAGMNDFLSKPIDKAQLYLLLHHYLKDNKVQNTPEVEETLNLHFSKDVLMEKTGNNSEFLQSLMELAEAEFPAIIAALEKALDDNDITGIKTNAHTLKGSSYNLEFIVLGNLANELENSIDNPADMSVIIRAIVDEWKVVSDLIK